MGQKLETKSDTSENWAKAKNFTPKKGTIIYYSDTQQVKIGDGATNVNDLHFIGSQIMSDYNEDEMTLTLSWK